MPFSPNENQLTFSKLKTPCVNLSSVALRFRTKEASAKDILRALEDVRDTLDGLGKANKLDPKLAEYAFFPLAQQVFNEAKNLSPRCLEVAADCVTLLVTYGYRRALLPELGKQLLILMVMLAGAGPNAQSQPPTDELKIAAFNCITKITSTLASTGDGRKVFDDQGTKNVVDQLAYLLLEAITDSPSDQVQISASSTLSEIVKSIQSRVFLASLLPRTVSSLIKALRPSTKARRTQKVLVSFLQTLQRILLKTVADRVTQNVTLTEEKSVLDGAWLKATSTQIKSALLQVSKLRQHDGLSVRNTLGDFCAAIIEECQQVLSDSLPVMLETLVVLSSQPDGENATAICKHLLLVYPQLMDMLQQSFSNWSSSLPRQMQSQDERVRQLALRKLSSALPLISEAQIESKIAINLLPLLRNGIVSMMNDTPIKLLELQELDTSSSSLLQSDYISARNFENFILSHESQKETQRQLRELLAILRQLPGRERLTRSIVDTVAETEGDDRVAALWLATRLLESTTQNDAYDLLDFIEDENTALTRTAILADLHASIFPLISSVIDDDDQSSSHWQSQALAIESLVLYAQSFPGETYRPELVDTLYPVLAFLGSSNSILRSHAIVALDKLARTCQYASTQDLLVQNVDYLVNSIAWKLNVYTLSPEAPVLLRMMVHLCGADLIPYLDDLIQSIFAALDNYHGYSDWVESLFSTLKTMVDVSMREPQKAITQSGNPSINRNKNSLHKSTTEDIFSDLQARKRRKLDFDRDANEPPTKTPHRPWTNALDGPSFPKEADSSSEDLREPEDDRLASMKSSEDEKEPKLSKSHTMLLSIAQSTVPHLASPSPKVRHLLLDLLKDIAPLLSQDEKSFLPLINTIWPVVVPRLFADQQSEEISYNIIAAAETIAILCQHAGDFMSSRIEDIFQQLVRLFKSTQTLVQSDKSSGKNKSASSGVSMRAVTSIVPQDDTAIATNDTTRLSITSSIRTSQGQVLNALLNLLVAVLDNVSLTLDTGDTVMDLLLPFANLKSEVRVALGKYNEDKLWYWDIRSGVKSNLDDDDDDDQNGDRSTSALPVLRGELFSEGISLIPYVI